MKKMTKQEILDSKVGELGFEIIKIGSNHYLDHSQMKCIDMGLGDGLFLDDVGIKLIPDKPPITIENLGRFMAKFDKYPLAEFKGPYGVGFPAGERVLSVCCKDSINYVCSEHYCWPVCEITDERWTVENLGGGR
jgi:hypothetical protein